MATTIGSTTWSVFTERIKRRLFNGWQSVAENTTDREIQLYIQEAIAAVMVQRVEKNISLEGVRQVPEGFITTYSFTWSLSSNPFTVDYTRGLVGIILPQPIIGLPLGYSIVEPYFGNTGQMSYPLIAVHSFQRSYYNKLPTPNFGAYYWVENNNMYIDFQGGDYTTIGTLYVPMLATRSETGNDTDIINIPDDAMSMVFDIVIKKLTERVETPSDNVNDGIYAPTQRERI